MMKMSAVAADVAAGAAATYPQFRYEGTFMAGRGVTPCYPEGAWGVDAPAIDVDDVVSILLGAIAISEQ